MTLILKSDLDIMKMYLSACKTRRYRSSSLLGRNLFGISVSKSYSYFITLGLHLHCVPGTTSSVTVSTRLQRCKRDPLYCCGTLHLCFELHIQKIDIILIIDSFCYSSMIDATPSVSAHTLVLRHVLTWLVLLEKIANSCFYIFGKRLLFPWQSNRHNVIPVASSTVTIFR